jgi:hypothetical protein
MVFRDDKKQSAPHRKRKVGAVEALLADPVDLSITKAEKSALRNSRTNRRSSVISAFVYDKSPATVPVRIQRSSNFTFTAKLRNVIQFIFESLRETIAQSAKPSEDIEKSIHEMRSLNGSPENRLNAELKRHLMELMEETEAFVKGEKTGLTGVPDFQSALHYRHYVRIAWLSHFILKNLPGPIFS